MTTKWNGRPELALLAEKEEDRFTQFLCELLRSDAVMDGFLRLCGLTPERGASALHPSTQVTVPGGRLDLAIHGPDTYLLFEAKVGSWLHDGQLVPYAKDLLAWAVKNPGGRSRMILLAPAATLLEIEAAAVAQLQGTGFLESPRCVSWEQVARMCAGLKEAVEPPELRVHLATFTALVERRLGQAQEPFSSEEIALLANPLTGRAVHRAAIVLTKLIECLKRGGPDFKVDTTKAAGLLWQGRNLYLNRRWWWVGLWPPVWSTVGGSPLLLQVPGMTDAMLASVPKHLPRPVLGPTTAGDGFVVPLPLHPAMPLDEIAQALASIVRDYLVQVPDSGGTSRAHTEADEE
ncbi:hypothetical protein [Corallococcus exercitus]|uniref:hypothetical protein n=1 Tax=Corallococcus exercitus TaxID=2316736 RepID=UPI0035D43923